MKQLTREEKISEIYEKIANKELSKWCRIMLHWHRRIVDFLWIRWGSLLWFIDWDNNEIHWFRTWIKKYIWHPVMIWDVLDWMYHNFPEESPYDKITWDYFRKPIDDQPDDCINFIHSLLEQWQK